MEVRFTPWGNDPKCERLIGEPPHQVWEDSQEWEQPPPSRHHNRRETRRPKRSSGHHNRRETRRPEQSSRHHKKTTMFRRTEVDPEEMELRRRETELIKRMNMDDIETFFRLKQREVAQMREKEKRQWEKDVGNEMRRRGDEEIDKCRDEFVENWDETRERDALRNQINILREDVDRRSREKYELENEVKILRYELFMLKRGEDINEERIKQAKDDHELAIQMQESIDEEEEEASRKLAEQLQGES